jgi:hypothetical protein
MLRHACGYALADKGLDTRTLQAYLGHRSINSTTRYAALAPGRFKKHVWAGVGVIGRPCGGFILASRATIRAPSKGPCSGIAISSPQSAIRSWPPIGSRISGGTRCLIGISRPTNGPSTARVQSPPRPTMHVKWSAPCVLALPRRGAKGTGRNSLADGNG